MVARGGDGGASDDENKIRIVIFLSRRRMCHSHLTKIKSKISD
jgi:hypothetical protein